MKSINLQIDEILKNESLTIEELKNIEPIFRENSNTCARQFFKSYLFSIIAITIWFLINSSIIKDVKILDITINNKEILLLSIPFIALLMCYKTNSNFFFYQEIDRVLKSIYMKLFPNFGATTLVYFLEFPAFSTLENIRSDLNDDSFFSSLNIVLIWSILVIIPICIIIWISIKLILMYWLTWYLIFPFLYLLIAIKIVTDIIFWMKS